MIYLDHVGLVGSSIESLRREWQGKGFFVTEPEELLALDANTGQRVSLGQHSCHIILEQGYIELTAVDTVSPSHHLSPWIRDHDSLAIIAVGADEIERVRSRLEGANVSVGPLAHASRPIHYGARRGDALFTWFALGAESTPEALLCFVRNERPNLIYQPEVQRHPNGAHALESVIICAQDPEAVSRRYSGYLASTAIEMLPDMLKCPLERGSIWIGTPSSIKAAFGHVVDLPIGEAPRAIGFGVAPTQIHWVSTSG